MPRHPITGRFVKASEMPETFNAGTGAFSAGPEEGAETSVAVAERPRVATWDVIGTDVSECKNNIDKVLSTAGLDYTVESRPVYYGTPDNLILSENEHAIVRTTDNYNYGTRKKSYTICQNREAFSLLEQLDDDIEVIRAGETTNGMIYLIAKMPEIKILGDSFTPNLIFQNSHTADFALKSALIPLRIACTNQYNVAFPEARNTQTIKHTASIGSQIANMNDVMKNTAKYLTVFNEQAEKLATKKIDVNKLIDVMFGKEEDCATERGIRSRQEAIDRFMKAYNTDDNGNFRGTAWGIMNAATEFITHKPLSKGGEQGRFINTVLYPDYKYTGDKGNMSYKDIHKILQAA